MVVGGTMSAATSVLEPRTALATIAADVSIDSLLDEHDKFARLIPMVQVKSDQQNNLDDIFPMLLTDKMAIKENRITQHDLYKLDSFGAALAW